MIKIYDLIYGGFGYREELKSLFPTAIIEDASDEVHIGRISITIPKIDEKEYWRIITLNGFLEMSLYVQMKAMDEETKCEFKKEFEKWKIDYPQYFKGKKE